MEMIIEMIMMIIRNNLRKHEDEDDCEGAPSKLENLRLVWPQNPLLVRFRVGRSWRCGFLLKKCFCVFFN